MYFSIIFDGYIHAFMKASTLSHNYARLQQIMHVFTQKLTFPRKYARFHASTHAFTQIRMFARNHTRFHTITHNFTETLKLSCKYACSHVYTYTLPRHAHKYTYNHINSKHITLLIHVINSKYLRIAQKLAVKGSPLVFSLCNARGRPTFSA